MMHYFIRSPWDLPQRVHTPEETYQNRRRHRREFLQSLGLTGAGLLLAGFAGCEANSDEEILSAGAVAPLEDDLPNPYNAGPNPVPAPRNPDFEYGRAETQERKTAEYTNFYEFASTKDSWRRVGRFQPDPWTVEVTGLCAQPQTFDMDDLYRMMSFQERHYRHRCVETWAMCVPWTGFRLRDLLEKVEPSAAAKYVRFVTFGQERKDQAPQLSDSSQPWPYTEGLTIAEATSELAFIATGIYGHQLPKQNGAPIRLVTPWKYGFKSIKSIVKIELVDKPPATFWNTLAPHEYGFSANVDPEVSHPRWSQRREWMLGTREEFDTVQYNGYGTWVGDLYPT